MNRATLVLASPYQLLTLCVCIIPQSRVLRKHGLLEDDSQGHELFQDCMQKPKKTG
jgi:hypothetical protein